MIKYDVESARGTRAPGEVPTNMAWVDVKRVREAFVALEKVITTVVPDCEERAHLLRQIDTAGIVSEALVVRHNRNGSLLGATPLGDMEATLRCAQRNPEQFKSFDVDGLRKAVAALKKASR